MNGGVAEAEAVERDIGEPLIAPATVPVSDSIEVPAVEPDAVETPAAEPGVAATEPDGEESQVRRKRPSPTLPSASEFKEHKLTHIPYRSWCDECVECFGREWGHHGDGQLEKRRVPVVSMDYLFVTRKGIFARDEISDEEAAGCLKVLVVYDSTKKCVFAHAVPPQGR